MQCQETGNPRDFYLNCHDISNIDVKLQEDTWRLHKNQAQSVRLFAQQNEDKVILYQEQQLHKGAAEQLQQAARSRSTLDLQAEDIMERSTAAHGSQVPSGGVASLATAADRIAAPQSCKIPTFQTS